jgi:hypothetical protein
MTRGTCDGPHPYPEPGHPHPEGRRCYCARCERAGHRWAWSLAEACQEIGQTGLCGRGHPVTTLAGTVAGRLYTAGITPEDPGLASVRAWNAVAVVRSVVSSVTGGAKPGTPGPARQRGADGPLRDHGRGVCPSPGGHQPQKNSAPAHLWAESASTSESHVEPVAVALAGAATGPTHHNRSLTAPASPMRRRR